MANDTQKEYPNLLCYIKWKSLVNLKCICWAKSKYLYTSGINSTKGAALACSLHSKVVRRENSQSLQVSQGNLAPPNSAVPPSSPGDSTRPALTPRTPLWCHSTFWKLPPSLKCSEDRGTKRDSKKNSLNNEKGSQTAEC